MEHSREQCEAVRVSPTWQVVVGIERDSTWSCPRSLPRGPACSSSDLFCVFPAPPGGLAVEDDPGCVPGPAWEEGLPSAGGGPGALQTPRLPLCSIHLLC